MALATASPDGMPSVRIVLLKGIDDRGHPVLHQLRLAQGPRAGREPARGGDAALGELHRAVRLEGAVERLTAEESDAYFASRGRGSRLGAWASRQGTPIPVARGARGRVRRGRRALPGRRRAAAGVLGRLPARARRGRALAGPRRTGSTTASTSCAATTAAGARSGCRRELARRAAGRRRPRRRGGALGAGGGGGAGRGARARAGRRCRCRRSTSRWRSCPSATHGCAASRPERASRRCRGWSAAATAGRARTPTTRTTRRRCGARSGSTPTSRSSRPPRRSSARSSSRTAIVEAGGCAAALRTRGRVGRAPGRRGARRHPARRLGEASRGRRDLASSAAAHPAAERAPAHAPARARPPGCACSTSRA